MSFEELMEKQKQAMMEAAKQGVGMPFVPWEYLTDAQQADIREKFPKMGAAGLLERPWWRQTEEGWEHFSSH